MNTSLRPLGLCVAVASVVYALLPSLASANHSWGKYHWPNPKHPGKLELNVGNNLSGVSWGGGFLQSAAISPWNAGCAGDVNGTPDSCLGNQPSGSAGMIASRVSLTPVSGGTSPATCSPITGRVEVCNYAYGDTGWLGLAQIWVSRFHIAQGVAKMNDTYLNEPPYNTEAWRQLVLCQEIGHTFGLDHQDEIFGNPNLGTCMDYTSNPLGPPANTAPNYHDFEQLVTIYGHSDTSSSGGGPGKGGNRAGVPPATYDNLNDRAKWGVLKRESNGGRTAVYERDLADGYKLVTFVIWAK